MQEKSRLSSLKKHHQKSEVARKAWNRLRLALLWARKGGVLKNKIVMDLRLVPKYLKSLRHQHPTNDRGALYYGERELSFDETPIIHIKMHRPASLRFKMPQIPCIKPHVDFDYDFDDHNAADEIMYYDNDVVARKSFLKNNSAADEENDGDDDDDEEQSSDEIDYVNNDQNCCGGGDENEIDLKAEKFIATFYEQMKLQRQISYIQYKEMLNRGAN